MTEVPLLHIDGATEGTTQWKAETLQLLNWGGFEGHHTISFSVGATLLSGASGTGKSTLLDGYIALMMPSDTPFNGASNDATVGRARGEAQRNLLSYVRGKTDTGRDAGTNTRRDAVLRGGDGPTWSALAMTFVDDNNRRLTVLRIYLAPRGATKTGNMGMKMATVDGTLDLRDLQPLAAKDFDQADLKARFPGLTPHRTYTELAETLYARLGIGAGGDGEKALRLLARIQTGEQVKTVDQLYKTTVLERPATYVHADRASDHFADLDLAYEAMVTEAHKAELLQSIVSLHDDLQSAQRTVDQIDQLGLDRAGATPFRLWQLTTETSLLTQVINANRIEHKTKAADAEIARQQVNDLEQRRDDLSRQISQSGGDTLTQLEKEINDLRRDLDDAHRARNQFDEHTGVIGGPAARDKTAFDRLLADAEQFLSGSEDAEQTLEAEKRKLYEQAGPLQDKIEKLDEEKTYLTGRDGLIPQHLHLARLRMAEAARIPHTDLPFVAELIDLAPDEETWRKAAEVTLASITRVMLVDDEKLERLSRSIDALHLPIRVNFQGVPLKPHQPDGEADPRWISGKLVHKPSPFTHWIRDRVQANGVDALCVDTPEDLAGGGRRVTRNGQTRQGRRGAHGDLADRNVIGFSNQARINEIKIELADLHIKLAAVNEQAGKLSERTRDLNKRRSAYQYLRSIAWRSIDTDDIQTSIDTTQALIDDILQDSDQLRKLQAAAQTVDTELKTARRTQFLVEKERDDLEAEHEKLTEQFGKASADLTAISVGQTVADNIASWLNGEFAAVGDVTDLEHFPAGVSRLRDRLTRTRDEARGKISKATNSIEGIFRSYKNQWDDPNLGTTMLSYQAYRDIYDDIIQAGLHERRDVWKRRLAKWSGEDLVPLNGAFDTAIDLIEERLQPVNAILASLPFGARRERLEIRLDRKDRDPNVAAFRRELKQLSSGLTQQMSDDDAEQRFVRLRAFMQRIRKPDDSGSRSTAQRDRLLDVRKHIEITAVCLTPDGVERCIYKELGGKSGGESQELVAFIVGAALRFQLGDESRTRPRFAPVVLDEAFIKSDGEFAGRGVRAWKALGFQLIVGAPFDKVTALEPHMDLLLVTTKDPATQYSYVTTLTARQDEP